MPASSRVDDCLRRAGAVSARNRPTNDTPVAVRVLGNNMPIVRGEVNGKPCTLLFDTGATHTTIVLKGRTLLDMFLLYMLDGWRAGVP